MAVWFGHTQTLTSISKSVSTVASGILGLEDNLATFMKKVRVLSYSTSAPEQCPLTLERALVGHLL